MRYLLDRLLICQAIVENLVLITKVRSENYLVINSVNSDDIMSDTIKIKLKRIRRIYIRVIINNPRNQILLFTHNRDAYNNLK